MCGVQGREQRSQGSSWQQVAHLLDSQAEQAAKAIEAADGHQVNLGGPSLAPPSLPSKFGQQASSSSGSRRGSFPRGECPLFSDITFAGRCVHRLWSASDG